MMGQQVMGGTANSFRGAEERKQNYGGYAQPGYASGYNKPLNDSGVNGTQAKRVSAQG
jgi:hypothetical protein